MSCNDGKKKSGKKLIPEKKLISKIVAETYVKTFKVVTVNPFKDLNLEFKEPRFMVFWMSALERSNFPIVYTIFISEYKKGEYSDRYTFYDDDVIKIIIDGKAVIENR